MTAIQLRSLGGFSWTEVHAAMQEAFSDYAADMSYMTETLLRHRGERNGVDLAGSVGAFVEGRIVGFTLVGYGRWHGEPGAFDAGTGILKAYRGQKLAGEMFAFLEPELRSRGCTTFLLDVMSGNEAAQKAYRASGFNVLRTVDVLDLESFEAGPAPEGLEILPASLRDLWSLGNISGSELAWENAFEGLARVEDSLLLRGAFLQGECVGVGVADPVLRWICFLGVREDRRGRGIGSALLGSLLAGLGANGRPPRVYNLDSEDQPNHHFLLQRGFVNLGSQLEMGRDLIAHA